jgi:hypothetical protein
MKLSSAVVLAVLCGACLGSRAQSQTATATAANSAPLTADAIMARVAANQDRSEELRKEYVYRQHIHVATHKTNAKLLREETTDYHVVPAPKSTQRRLEKLTGRYMQKGRYVDFSGEPVPDADSIDAQLIKDFRGEVIEPKSKDGVGHDLFPLTTGKQKQYKFRLLGRDTFQGRDAYHVAFDPADKNDIDWSGEAYIDANEFEPIYVFTKLSRKIPFAVRTLLGTDLPGVGFSVRYVRQPDGVWFPKSFGTEFTLHVLFFLNRQISLSLDNADFERTHVETKIDGEAVGVER